jgi:MFS family permease
MLWSAGTALAALSPSYPVLLASRLLYAAGYAFQNPVAFGIIPEIFPRSRASAMAAYNVAIHLGRAISFGGGALAAPQTHPGPPEPQPPAGSVLVPLDSLDLGSLAVKGLTILYLVGDALVLAPVATPVMSGDSHEPLSAVAALFASAARVFSGTVDGAERDWRSVLLFLSAPGAVLVPMLLLTVRDPGRDASGSRSARRRLRLARRPSAQPAGDTGALGTVESSMAKVAVSEALMRIADRCVQVMGGMGVSGDTIVEQVFREVRAFRIYDGPTEVHKWSLAKKVKRDWKAAQGA